MAQVLQQESCGFALFCPPLLNEQATTSSVRDAVLDLADELQEEDFALFFFSGHVQALTTEADLDDVYLVTHDFNASRVKRGRNAYLSLRWLRQVLFEHETAKHVLLRQRRRTGVALCDQSPHLVLWNQRAGQQIRKNKGAQRFDRLIGPRGS